MLFAGGVSAFAFQGTNAHAVLSTSAEGGGSVAHQAGQAAVCARKQRFWISPPASALLHTVLTFPHNTIVFAADLAMPSLHFLMGHRVGNRAVLPATGGRHLR